ncbi:MAG TPA: J domain-containing protein [Polyangiales bacterium]|nr:J domain-containing protein [Polyangiales bacterium]
MSELASAVISIAPTLRRRFFWAAWWTRSPRYAPFQKPDASNGGARSRAEALAEAQRTAGRHLTEVEDHWAMAWKRVLRGEHSPEPPAVKVPRVRAPAPVSAWELRGLAPGATLSELKRAYRQRALETHPDQGGESEQFQRVQRAYEKLSAQLARKR